ncbi:hypothetical protein R9X47_20745 [Wukongibacter baidiensis]|uniref:hypothetical protein n=1 Tax=Wukongibacter baidiensis TaxID=1723361 RepID=UPI003D7F8CA7
MWKKIGLTISIIFVIISLGLCMYFYNQDYLILWKYSIDKEIELENCVVKIEEIRLHNFEKKGSFIKNQFELYKFIGKLPEFMRKPCMNTYLVLNPPYEIDNEFLRIKLSGSIVSDDLIGSNHDSENIIENIKIDIIDEVGVNYSRGRTWEHDSSSNIVPFEIRGEYFRIDRTDNTITIVVTDKEKNNTYKFEVKPEYIKETYNHFYNRTGF